MRGRSLMERLADQFRTRWLQSSCSQGLSAGTPGAPVPEYPQGILIEPTNACNLRCRMCSAWGEGVKKTREVGFIKREIWMKALDEIGSWPVQVQLSLTGAGEPLAHPDFLEILSYAQHKDNISVGFLCNATLLNSRKAEAVAGLKIAWIGFSVDGAQREIFEYYRGGAVFSEVEANIERLLSLREGDKPAILLNMVSHGEADIGLFIERWKGKVDTIQISLQKPVDRDLNRRIRFRKPCPSLDRQLVMGWSGHVALCCDDGWGEYIIGKSPEESLHTIWHSDPMNRARTLHREGSSDKIDLCRTCDSAVFHDFFEMNLEKTRIRVELPSIRREDGYWEPETRS